LAQATQGFGLTGLVSQLAIQGEGLAEAAGAVLVAPLEKLGYRQVKVRVGLVTPVT